MLDTGMTRNLSRENANEQAASTDSMGNRDETQDGRYSAHVSGKSSSTKKTRGENVKNLDGQIQNK